MCFLLSLYSIWHSAEELFATIFFSLKDGTPVPKEWVAGGNGGVDGEVEPDVELTTLPAAHHHPTPAIQVGMTAANSKERFTFLTGEGGGGEFGDSTEMSIVVEWSRMIRSRSR